MPNHVQRFSPKMRGFRDEEGLKTIILEYCCLTREKASRNDPEKP